MDMNKLQDFFDGVKKVGDGLGLDVNLDGFNRIEHTVVDFPCDTRKYDAWIMEIRCWNAGENKPRTAAE